MQRSTVKRSRSSISGRDPVPDVPIGPCTIGSQYTSPGIHVRENCHVGQSPYNTATRHISAVYCLQQRDDG